MKRLHVHVAVTDLQESIGYYAALFGAQPNVLKSDYAKWRLEDPRVNFAISQRQAKAGLDHLGIEVDSDAELAEVAGRLSHAKQQVRPQENASCCYAKSNKAWSRDPSGLSWETFFTHGEVTTYGEDHAPDVVAKPANQGQARSACCG